MRLPVGLISLLLFSLAACGTVETDGSKPKGELLACFDMELKPWSPPSVRTEEAARNGDWGCFLDGTHHGSSTYSPLISLEDYSGLEVSWWARCQELGPRGALFMAHGYRDAPSPHAAIPPTPLHTGATRLGRYVKVPSTWRKLHASLDREDLGAGATWMRLEWRMYLNQEERGAHAGYIAFDDIVVRSRGQN